MNFLQVVKGVYWYFKEFWLNLKGDIPDTMKVFFVISIILALNLCFAFSSHKIHIWAQHNKSLYKIISISDCMEFMCNGGGSFGYQNQYKWAYAKWINNPERTPLQKAFFWECGFLYDATDPPEEYQYPPLFE